MESKIKKASNQVQLELDKRPLKKNRTLSLTNDSFVKLQQICLAEGVSASQVIDRLIQAFVEQNPQPTPKTKSIKKSK